MRIKWKRVFGGILATCTIVGAVVGVLGFFTTAAQVRTSIANIVRVVSVGEMLNVLLILMLVMTLVTRLIMLRSVRAWRRQLEAGHSNLDKAIGLLAVTAAIRAATLWAYRDRE